MNFAAARSGATAIEYAMIATVISIVIVGALSSIGTSVNTMFSSVLQGFR